ALPNTVCFNPRRALSAGPGRAPSDGLSSTTVISFRTGHEGDGPMEWGSPARSGSILERLERVDVRADEVDDIAQDLVPIRLVEDLVSCPGIGLRRRPATCQRRPSGGGAVEGNQLIVLTVQPQHGHVVDGTGGGDRVDAGLQRLHGGALERAVPD